MSERLWYPVDLIDEYTPPGRATPEAWLSPEFPGVRDYEQHFIDEHYGPGDRIAFKWCEHLPMAYFEVRADGTLARPTRCPETPDMFTGDLSPEAFAPPAYANSFYDHETEIWADTPEEFARLYAACFDVRDGGFDFGATPSASVAVQCARWSKTIHFTINADGKSLTPVEAKEADS